MLFRVSFFGYFVPEARASVPCLQAWAQSLIAFLSHFYLERPAECLQFNMRGPRPVASPAEWEQALLILNTVLTANTFTLITVNCAVS